MSARDELPLPAATFPEPPGFEDDIPVIDDAMLHAERVDFEHRMSVVPVVSIVLISLCAIAFGLQLSKGTLDDLDALVHVGALHRESVLEGGQVWRLVSPMFLHGSIDHLLGNVLILFVLGVACEHGFGRPQFVALYVASGVVGALFSLLGGRPSVGASGAIFGLAGALIVLFVRYRHRLTLRDARIGWVLAIWAGYQLLLGLNNPAIDNLAHLGGLLGGAVTSLVLRPAVLDGRAVVARRPATIGLVALAGLALIGTFVVFVPRLLE